MFREFVIVLSILFDNGRLEHTMINYNIAVLFEYGNKQLFDIPKSAPAIEIGIEMMQEMIGQRINLNLSRSYIKLPLRKCLPYGFETKAAELYHMGEIDGFIGPAFSRIVETVGLMAAVWHVPMLTPVGTSIINSNKQVYTTLTRVGHINDKFAKLYVALLEHFNYTDVALLYDRNDYVSDLYAGDIQNALHPVTSSLSVIPMDFKNNVTVVHDALLTASRFSRVFYIKCSGPQFRELMLEAKRLGMTEGDYIFVFIRLFEGDTTGDMSWDIGDHSDQMAKIAYNSVLMMQDRTPPGAQFDDFDNEVKLRAKRDHQYDWGSTPVNIFIQAAYDMFALYATSINETLNAGEDLRNSHNILKRMWNRTFEGAGGPVTIDENGDRDVDFSLMDMDPKTGAFKEIAYFKGSTGEFILHQNVYIHWPNNKGPPPNKPRCGFLGDAPGCQDNSFPMEWTIAIALGLLLILIGTIGGAVYRKMKLETDLQSEWWKVPWSAISLFHCMGHINSSRISHIPSRLSDTPKQTVEKTAVYKGIRVKLDPIHVRSVNLDRTCFLELKQMRDCHHSNLAKFHGMCIEEPNVCILSEFCTRGSLSDILHNDSIHLDDDFKKSLINDIVQGMCYLHQSSISIHGRLNSSCCIIDSRFALKIAGFGLMSVRSQEIIPGDLCNKGKLRLFYIAPELLRLDPRRDVSKPGDVFSFGVMLYEIITRTEPYDEEILPVLETLTKIRLVEKPPYRPKFRTETVNSKVSYLAEKCWSEYPRQRPSFPEITAALDEAGWFIHGVSLMGMLMGRMEQYANNLENLVDERTRAFVVEKKKSEDLLYHILPKSVANQLKNGNQVLPETFDSVTIYFSDIVGFTSISATSTPVEIVDLLNGLYTLFDGILEKFDAYKVETIGDAYMVVSGLPMRNAPEHARQIARVALSIVSKITSFRIAHQPNTVLRVRIGVHSGRLLLSLCWGSWDKNATILPVWGHCEYSFKNGIQR
ncbi:hypothetical protein ScPMuIL_002615 [Solemya velum]